MTDYTMSTTVARPYDTTVTRALQADPRVATLLPCNVVVTDQGDRTRVEVLDPGMMTSFSPDLAAVAGDARTRLSAVLSGLDDPQESTDANRT